ncbi:hypothetical protein GCM10023149_04750 [Mucilaginibacter gynuensis]|uniref:FecR protein domain-containing protein n=1 Tax=Mucilaginibacter gynuensis TaxID=1302236 RepID=A0ABP8FSI2_9SPHI
MQHSVFKKLLKKYHSDTATPAERYIVDTWYNSFDENGKVPGTLTDDEAEATRLRLFHKIIPVPVLRPWYRRAWLQAAAAIIIVPTLAVLIYMQGRQSALPKQTAFEDIAFNTDAKQVKKITLQDSTTVWLNANSNLRIKGDYGNKSRRLQLKGEAYFDVKHDTLRPFIISVEELSIKDLGTTFNVKAYKKLNNIKVSVNSGKVEVSTPSRVIAQLMPGKALSYNLKTGQFTITDIKITGTSSWTEGKTVLARAGFDELQQELLNMYGIKLNSTDEKVKSFKYNLTLRSSQTKDDVLDIITTMLNKKHKKEGPDGVIIY